MAEKQRAMDRLMVAEPYDMDTMIGTNNSGVLMFPPYLEDTDTVSAVISGEGGSDAPVFNAQDSVLWQNLRDAFRDQITTMYRNLRAGDKWNAKYIANYFDEMQSKWPEAMFNEDGRTKYLIPLIDPVTVDEDTGELIRTDRYLTMLQGSKAMQRLWWLYNRFRYMDSKYNTGDASKTINLRLFNGGTLTLTPAIDLYVGVSFGGGTTPALKRTKAGQSQTFEYVAPSGVTEMETWIYSADLITDVGDLSVFYPNEIDVSRASRLRSLTIGNLTAGYSNSNLTTINASNNPLLEYINCANCPRLAISPNLEKSTRLKEAYFEGSGITGVELADGCTIEKLHLPASTTSLILTNLNKLTDLQIEDMSNITRVMLSNMSVDIIDPMDVLDAIPAGSQVYIDGLDITLVSDTEIQEFIDLLDTMRGVTRERGINGDWLYHDQESAQVNGTIHVNSTTGAMAKQLKDKYPYITLDFQHITCTVRFYNYDGTSVLQTKTSTDGAAVTYTGSTPTKPQSASHTFTFAGWSKSIDGTKNDNILKNVTEDRDVYPAFTSQLRTFTVTFKNWNNSTLQTVNNVPYGGTANYTSATPTNNSTGDTADFEFLGWSPEPINIVADTTCMAQFKDVSSVTLQYLRETLQEYITESVTTLPYYAFASQTKLKYIKGPITSFGNRAFYGSPNIETIDLTNTNLARISQITSMPHLTSVIIRSDGVSTLDSTCFYSTPLCVFRGAVYVPSSLVSAYKSDAQWKQYCILSIDDYPSNNIDGSTISDDLDTIISKINNNDVDYPIGSIKRIPYDNDYLYLQLVGIDKDVLSSDTSKTAKTTWACFAAPFKSKMHGTRVLLNNGYCDTDLHNALNAEKIKLPEIIRNNIKTVSKTYFNFATSSTKTTNEDIWLFSAREVGFVISNAAEDSGCIYDEFFESNSSRQKFNYLTGASVTWWLRTGINNYEFARVDTGGGYTAYGYINGENHVVFGLCL